MVRKRLMFLGLQTGVVCAGLACFWWGLPTLRAWLKPEAPPTADHKPGPRLGEQGLVILPGEAASTLGIKIAAAVEPKPGQGKITLAGSLALDPSRLTPVRSRFPGEIVEIGINPQSGKPWQFGDRVAKKTDEPGPILAVVWSKDLGEKKSEYLDALSQSRLDQETLKRLEKAYQEGGLPEARWREVQRNAESSTIAANKAERTLRSWRVSEEDIAWLRTEAERLGQPGALPRKDATWARVEIRAPQAGTILERTANVGNLIDSSADLFKIADLSRLTVWTHVYEEDLPRLLAMPQPIAWTIQPKNYPGLALPGVVEKIGQLVDPLQHTILITGLVDNSAGQLRAGQFITAVVDMPFEKNDLVIPTTALVEDGEESIVFVQPDKDKTEYALRHVAVRRRQRDYAHIRQGLAPGELVVAAGAVELRSLLETLHQEAPAKSQE